MIHLIDKDKVIEAIDDISVEIDERYGFQYEKWRKYFCELLSVHLQKGKWIRGDSENYMANGDVLYVIKQHIIYVLTSAYEIKE